MPSIPTCRFGCKGERNKDNSKFQILSSKFYNHETDERHEKDIYTSKRGERQVQILNSKC
jgi:hypothetical protein